MASKHIKNANQQILHMSPNTHGKGFPKQISSSLTTSTQLFLNVKSHLNPPPCSFTLPPPSPPNVESSGWSRPFVVDTIPRGTHTSYRSPQEKHLLFNPFANKNQLKLKAHAQYTHWIYHQQAFAKGHWEHAFRIDQRRERRKWGVAPTGRTPRSNDTPDLPLPRCSANQNSSVPQGRTGKISHLPCLNEATTGPKSTKGNQVAERPTSSLEMCQPETQARGVTLIITT